MCIAFASSYQELLLCKMFDESLPLMQLWKSSAILILEEIKVKQILPAKIKYFSKPCFFKS